MKLKQRRASSLILVLLVIAGVVTVVFGTQRLILVQFNQSNREEDNLFAYYAARAGIEDGLLRYRFNKNTETEEGKVFRYNVRTGSSETAEVNEDSPITSATNYKANQQYYDLKVAFKAGEVNVNNNGEPSFNAAQTITKDSTLQLSGFNSTPLPYYLRYVFQFDSSCADISRAFVQVETIYETGPLDNFVAPNSSLTDNRYDSSINIQNVAINSGRLATQVRFRPFFCNVQYALATTTKKDGLGGANSNPGPKFDSLTTNIIATGYFGTAKRSLIATVDRRTGVLIGIYEFNAYSGGNITR